MKGTNERDDWQGGFRPLGGAQAVAGRTRAAFRAVDVAYWCAVSTSARSLVVAEGCFAAEGDIGMKRLLFAGLHLVGGIAITALLILNVKNTSYPTAVGVALALFIGGSLTFVTVWLSLFFGGRERPDD